MNTTEMTPLDRIINHCRMYKESDCSAAYHGENPEVPGARISSMGLLVMTPELMASMFDSPMFWSMISFKPLTPALLPQLPSPALGVLWLDEKGEHGINIALETHKDPDNTTGDLLRLCMAYIASHGKNPPNTGEWSIGRVPPFSVITVGSADWKPSNQELEDLADLFRSAEDDLDGGVIITTGPVTINNLEPPDTLTVISEAMKSFDIGSDGKLNTVSTVGRSTRLWLDLHGYVNGDRIKRIVHMNLRTKEAKVAIVVPKTIAGVPVLASTGETKDVQLDKIVWHLYDRTAALNEMLFMQAIMPDTVVIDIQPFEGETEIPAPGTTDEPRLKDLDYSRIPPWTVE